MGKFGADRIIGQLAQQRGVAARRQDLKVAKTDKRRGDPADNRARFGFGIAVVKHVADHLIAGDEQAEGASGRHAQVVHRLATEKFAYRGTQHGQTIRAARIGGGAGTL